jgi:hypothetical protein
MAAASILLPATYVNDRARLFFGQPHAGDDWNRAYNARGNCQSKERRSDAVAPVEKLYIEPPIVLRPWSSAGPATGVRALPLSRLFQYRTAD